MTAKVKVMEPRFERKPMARATRVALFEREVRERLSSAAIDLLFARVRVISEGKRARSATLTDAFFGSIMMTFELATLEGDVREPLDPATAARLASLMESDARVQRRVRQLAEREGARLAGATIHVHSADVRLRVDGATVFVDVDVEGPPRT